MVFLIYARTLYVCISSVTMKSFFWISIYIFSTEFFFETIYDNEIVDFYLDELSKKTGKKIYKNAPYFLERQLQQFPLFFR